MSTSFRDFAEVFFSVGCLSLVTLFLLYVCCCFFTTFLALLRVRVFLFFPLAIILSVFEQFFFFFLVLFRVL